MKSDIVNPMPASHPAPKTAARRRPRAALPARAHRQPGRQRDPELLAEDQPSSTPRVIRLPTAAPMSLQIDPGVGEGEERHDREATQGWSVVLQPVQRRPHAFDREASALMAGAA